MPPKFYKMIDANIISQIIKYAAGITIIAAIVLAPAWVARQNGKGKPAMHAVRWGSWIFGWSGIGWLWALFWATKK